MDTFDEASLYTIELLRALEVREAHRVEVDPDAVVLDDADFDLAVEQVMLGAFRSAGQKCTATSRLVLTEAIADRFLDALLTRANALTVGDPADAQTQMGPVISASAQRAITLRSTSGGTVSSASRWGARRLRTVASASASVRSGA